MENSQPAEQCNDLMAMEYLATLNHDRRERGKGRCSHAAAETAWPGISRPSRMVLLYTLEAAGNARVAWKWAMRSKQVCPLWGLRSDPHREPVSLVRGLLHQLSTLIDPLVAHVGRKAEVSSLFKRTDRLRKLAQFHISNANVKRTTT